MIEKEAYEKQMETIREHSGAAFMQLRYDHCRFFKGDCNAATLLAHLLNLLRMKDSNPDDRKALLRNDLWFRCPAKDIRSALGMGEDRQRNAVEKATQSGVIETRHWAKNILWVRVNTEKLEQIRTASRNGETPDLRNGETPDLRNGVSPDLDPGKPRFSYTKKPSKKLSNNCCSQASNLSNGTLVHNTLNSCPPQKPDRATSQAKKLVKILRKKNKLVGGPPNIKAWAVQFRKLGLSRSAKEINSALDWYEEHFGEDYVPQAYSASAFVDKFLKIEAAIERGKRRFTTDENGYQRRVPKGDEDLYMKPGEEW